MHQASRGGTRLHLSLGTTLYSYPHSLSEEFSGCRFQCTRASLRLLGLVECTVFRVMRRDKTQLGAKLLARIMGSNG